VPAHCRTAQAVAAAAAAPGGGRVRLPDLPAPAGGGPAGTTPLQHFLYRSPARGQFVAPAFTTPLDCPALQRVRRRQGQSSSASARQGHAVGLDES